MKMYCTTLLFVERIIRTTEQNYTCISRGHLKLFQDTVLTTVKPYKKQELSLAASCICGSVLMC